MSADLIRWTGGPGSGKTHQLLEMVRGEVETGRTLDDMILMTFSRSQAADLADRLARSVACNGIPLCHTRRRLLCKSCRVAKTPVTPVTPVTPHPTSAPFRITRAIRAPFCNGIKSLTRYTRYISLFDGIGEEKQPDRESRISRVRSKGRRSA